MWPAIKEKMPEADLDSGKRLTKTHNILSGRTQQPYMNRTSVFLFFLAVAMLGCLQQQTTPKAEPTVMFADGTTGRVIPFERMERFPDFIDHPTAATYTFSDEKAWDDFRSDYPSKNTDLEGRTIGLPDVDFSQKTVLAVFLGKKTSGGYSTKVVRVVEISDAIMVYVQEITSGRGCTSAAVITYPGDIVTIQKTQKPVEFVFDKLERVCKS